MPNHCANQLTVTGPEYDRKRFALEALNGEALIYPDKRADEYRAKLVDAYGFDNWFGWRMEHWGTKWNCYHVTRTDDGGELVFFFKTAWCPFKPSVLAKMAERFPTLSFELLYGEIGCAFYGSMSASAGKLRTCSQGSLDDVSFYDHETGKYTWPAHLSEDVIRLLESSG